MKPYVKNYLDYFGYPHDPDAFIPCEVCGAKAVDIHHIRARGMGGTKERFINQVENCMALCRLCHEQYGDKKEYRDYLNDVHRRKLLASDHDGEKEIFYDHRSPPQSAR